MISPPLLGTKERKEAGADECLLGGTCDKGRGLILGPEGCSDPGLTASPPAFPSLSGAVLAQPELLLPCLGLSTWPLACGLQEAR